jgi:hypothetical protein
MRYYARVYKIFVPEVLVVFIQGDLYELITFYVVHQYVMSLLFSKNDNAAFNN